jgi:lysozyme
MTIVEQLILHEGLKLKPYEDVKNKLTIGVGRNLTDKGLSVDEVNVLLNNDISECYDDLQYFEWFWQLDKIREKVLIDLRFNLGHSGFRTFKNFIAALEKFDYNKAANELENSLWYKQVGARGKNLVQMMRTGVDL